MPMVGNLYIYGVEGVCTEAAPGQRSEKKSFRIQPYSSYKIAYPVFPTHNGTHEIRVEALTLYDSDAIVKKLYVVVSVGQLTISNSNIYYSKILQCSPVLAFSA